MNSTDQCVFTLIKKKSFIALKKVRPALKFKPIRLPRPLLKSENAALKHYVEFFHRVTNTYYHFSKDKNLEHETRSLKN